ncbi:ExbD/TolR family protein [Haliangium sp.]|uniref:ExbD/TolR family protein n=1 Tax=Haliangium sp. TaxID=2663208 RepID=UPI003D104466
MAGGTHRHGAIIDGINVTPLVDVTLVLLIIFIVTAKIVVAPAVPLDLPQASQSEAVQTIFAVSVSAEGALFVDGVACDDDELAAKARTARSRDRELRAVIQADRAVPHGRVMHVLDELEAAGIARVAFGALRPERPAPTHPSREGGG